MTGNDQPARRRPSDHRPTATVLVKPDLDLVPFARMIARVVLPDLTADEEPLYYGAITEVISNAIEAHRRDRLDDAVRVEVFADHPPMVRVSDCASGFDPEAALDAGGGLGLRIASAVNPDLAIASGPSGTTVELPVPEELLE